MADDIKSSLPTLDAETLLLDFEMAVRLGLDEAGALRDEVRARLDKVPPQKYEPPSCESCDGCFGWDSVVCDACGFAWCDACGKEHQERCESASAWGQQ